MKSENESLTLENIFSNAPEEELRAIVSSIIDRLNSDPNVYYSWGNNKCGVCISNKDLVDQKLPNIDKPINLTDKNLNEFVKGLRESK